MISNTFLDIAQTAIDRYGYDSEGFHIYIQDAADTFCAYMGLPGFQHAAATQRAARDIYKLADRIATREAAA